MLNTKFAVFDAMRETVRATRDSGLLGELVRIGGGEVVSRYDRLAFIEHVSGLFPYERQWWLDATRFRSAA